jgi:hypothetical protein
MVRREFNPPITEIKFRDRVAVGSTTRTTWPEGRISQSAITTRRRLEAQAGVVALKQVVSRYDSRSPPRKDPD